MGKLITVIYYCMVVTAYVNCCDTITDLGMVFNPKLSFVPLEEVLVLFSYRVLRFILSKLEYASVCWSPINNIHDPNFENIQIQFLTAMHLQFLHYYLLRGYSQEMCLGFFLKLTICLYNELFMESFSTV